MSRLSRILRNTATTGSLVLSPVVAAAWLRTASTHRFEGLTFNSQARADGWQFHYCITNGPFGVSFSHHRVQSARLNPGWLPFASVNDTVTRATTAAWYRSEGGRGAAGIWT